MKKISAFILTVMLAISIVGCGSGNGSSAQSSAAPESASAASASAESTAADGVDRSDWVKLHFKYNTFQNDTNIINYCLNVYFLGRLQDEMPGLVEWENFYNGTLLSQADTIDGIEEGIADIAMVDQTATPGRLPVLDMFTYPGVYSTGADAATRTLYEFIKTEQPEELNNVHFLFCHRAGSGMILTKEPLDGWDLSGMQVRASANFATLAQSLNGTVVTMPISDVYEALRNGMVDGTLSIGPIFSYMKLHEVAGYAKQVPLATNMGLVIMNKELYDSMPDSQKAVFDAVAEETQELCFNNIEVWGEHMESYYEFLNGLKELTWMEGDELAEATQRSQGAVEEYAKQLNEMGYDGDHYLESYRTIQEKYNEQFPQEKTEEDLKAFMNGEDPVIDTKAECERLLEESRAN